MAYIRHIPPARASGRLAYVYREVRADVPRVPNLIQVFSLRPEIMATVFRSWLSIMWSGHVSRRLKEMIAVVTSKSAQCDYCADAHMVFLLATGIDRARAYELESELHEAAWLDERERAALSLAARLSKDPSCVGVEDIAAFAEAWPRCEERTEIVSVAAAFGAITRMANALGVGFEIPAAFRRFETARRGALSLMARLTAMSLDLSEKQLPARAPEDNHAALVRLFSAQLGFSGVPPGFHSLETCPEIFDGQLRTIEKMMCVMPRDRWMRVGLVVGKLNGCTYFADQCGRWLQQRGVDPAAVIAASEGGDSTLPEIEEVCLGFTRDLTLHSHTIDADRIRDLRALGLSDGAILDLAYVSGVFNGIARLVKILTPLEERVAA